MKQLKNHDSTENVTDSLGATLETIVSKKKNSSFPRIFGSLPQFYYGSLRQKNGTKCTQLLATWPWWLEMHTKHGME